MKKRSKRLMYVLKKLRVPVAVVFILMALVFTVFRAMTPWVKQYKPQIETQLSSLLGQPVSIDTLRTGWYWFQPVLRFDMLQLNNIQQNPLQLDKLMVGIDLFRSLLHWRLEPGMVYLDGLHLSIHQTTTGWEMNGLDSSKPSTISLVQLMPILSSLVSEDKLIIKNLSAYITLASQQTIELEHIHLKALNQFNHYRVQGEVMMTHPAQSNVNFLADLTLDESHLEGVSGEIYIKATHLDLGAIGPFLPKLTYQIPSGIGDIQLWLSLDQGNITSIQSALTFQGLAWKQSNIPTLHQIQSLQANVAWLPTQAGWQLSGNQVKLTMANTIWPVNQFQWTHVNTTDTDDFYIQTMLLSPLLMEDFNWPSSMQPLLNQHPFGRFKDTQLSLQNHQLTHVLTRFVQAGWHAGDPLFPSVSQLAGVVDWYPEQGRLAVDTHNALLTWPKLPSVSLGQLNVLLNWKNPGSGMQYGLEHLVIVHPNLVVSAEGALDKTTTDHGGLLTLNADFSLKEVQRWLIYIPSPYLKKKLDRWLKENIKSIAQFSGKIAINGGLYDFPYGNTPGQLSIHSFFSGANVFFNDKWPISNNVDGYLRFDNRLMEIDIQHGVLSGIDLNPMNLRIDGLGLGKETLLVHSRIETAGKNLTHLIFSSPLKSKLIRMKKMKVEGNVGLDLQLEIPLYPENDDVLALGQLTFEDNTLIVHHPLKEMHVNHIRGNLDFTEHGVTQSELKASIMGDPVNAYVQSIRGKNPYTQIRILGDTTVDMLNTNYNLPLFSLMQGHLGIESILTLTDDPNDFDHVRINTLLEDVDIDLPKPLGKMTGEKTPLSIDLDFNPEKAIKVKMNYDNRLSGQATFTRNGPDFTLDKGILLVGSGAVPAPTEPGMSIAGELSSLDVSAWQDALKKLPDSNQSSGIIGLVQSIHLGIHSLALWGHEYSDVNIQASKRSPTDWEFKIQQSLLAGSLQYNLPKNQLTGHFEHLYLDKAWLNKKNGSNDPIKLSPEKIPNIALSVDEFKLGDAELGHLNLNTNSEPNRWVIRQFELKSPSYDFQMTGEWQTKIKPETTHLKAELKLTSLADILNRLGISPAVEANRGNLLFEGGWNGSIFDFSLVKVYGDMFLSLKDGRITHLSKETEEKLGLGKLLSILSLQTIPRRLKLDFSDLSMTGYSFDIFKGNFQLKNGVMGTQDSYIEGPVAKVSMTGDLNIVKQLYDLNLLVIPHITASLPIVATIAGGPIAGIATWFASKLITQEFQKVSAYSYKVSGPWLSPVVQQVSMKKAE